MVVVDIVVDLQDGLSFWHVLVEGAIGTVAIFGVFIILRGTSTLKHLLADEIKAHVKYKEEADLWRLKAIKYIEGLSLAIDQQLSLWHLSVAEKEVALLLLKGLSLKEIASIRNTSEKTARAQSMAVYSKSGLSGRSELSAFFLEDLLMPIKLKAT